MSELPGGWASTTLGTVASLASGSTPKGVLTAAPGSTPFFKVADMNASEGKFMADARVTISEETASALGLRIFPTGSVIFPKVGGALHTNKKRVLTRPAAVDTNTMVATPTDAIDHRFLYYRLLAVRLSDYAHGSPVPSIKRSLFAEATLSLPPFREQERIVDVIEEHLSRLNAGVAALEHAHGKVRQWRASVFASCYAEHAAKHGLAALSDKIGPDAIFRDGDWVESKDQDSAGCFRLTQLADIGDGKWRNRSLRFMNGEQFARLSCTELKKNDILIARMPDPLGRACLFPGDEMPCVTVVDVAIVRVGGEGPDPRWLMWMLNSPQVRRQVAALQAGTTRKRISRRNLATVDVPNAPQSAQLVGLGQIEAAIDEISALEVAREQSLMRAAALRSSILMSAFSGKLVPQDPSDEPASVLLERISAQRASCNGHKSVKAHSRRHRKVTA
jgi:hypothetical protein